MKRYSVETTPSAEADIIDSFIWGCDKWGIDEAQVWANDLRSAILENLSKFPLRYPTAPDNDGSGHVYRQMFIGRYRVIFHIGGKLVRVIHVRGSFVDPDKMEISE